MSELLVCVAMVATKVRAAANTMDFKCVTDFGFQWIHVVHSNVRLLCGVRHGTASSVGTFLRMADYVLQLITVATGSMGGKKKRLFLYSVHLFIFTASMMSQTRRSNINRVEGCAR